jgi:hypothetical protein
MIMHWKCTSDQRRSYRRSFVTNLLSILQRCIPIFLTRVRSAAIRVEYVILRIERDGLGEEANSGIVVLCRKSLVPSVL